MSNEPYMIYVMTCNSTPGRLTRAQKKARKKAAMASDQFVRHMSAMQSLHYWDVSCQVSRRNMNDQIAYLSEEGSWSARYRRSCFGSYFRWKRLYKFDLISWRRFRTWPGDSRKADFRYL